METQLRNGVAIIGKMRDGLDGLQSAGGERIIPEAEIKNAVRLQAELNAINNKLATAMKPISEEIAAIQQGMLGDLLTIKSTWADIVGLAARLLPVLDAIPNAIRIARAELKDAFGLPVELPFPRPEGHPGEDVAAPALTVHGDKSRSLPSLTPKKVKAATPSTDEVETYINSLKKLAAAEEAEAQTLGLGNKAKQEAVDLAKALEAARERGTPLTQKERDQVMALADAYSAAKDKIDDFAKAQEAARATGEFFGQTLEGAIEKLALDGGHLKSVLLDIVKALEQAALKAVLLGEGPLGTLFGTVGTGTGAGAIGGLLGQALSFLPKFAEGGDLSAGHFGIAGENGPELIQGPGTITPFRAINAALNSGRGGHGGHAVAMTIDVRGAKGNAEIHEMIASGVRTGMEAVHGKIARDIGPMTIRWNRRFG